MNKYIKLMVVLLITLLSVGCGERTTTLDKLSKEDQNITTTLDIQQRAMSDSLSYKVVIVYSKYYLVNTNTNKVEHIITDYNNVLDLLICIIIIMFTLILIVTIARA